MLALASVLLLGASAEPLRPSSIEMLLARFAASPGLRARMEEEKHISLLREPLVSEGTLAFVPPHSLVRVVHEPVPSRLVIDAESLRYEAQGEEGRIDVRAHPTLRALAAGMRQLFAGDADALRSAFEVTWREDARDPLAWAFELRPREALMRERLVRIEVSGQGWSLTAMRVVESDGDETRMRFSDVEMRHVFDAAEVDELTGFGTVGKGADR